MSLIRDAGLTHKQTIQGLEIVFTLLQPAEKRYLPWPLSEIKRDQSEHISENDYKGKHNAWRGVSLCSGCGYTIFWGCANFAHEVAGKKFDEACICAGNEVKPDHATKKAVLLGQCAIVKNKENKEAFRVKGYPPNNKEVTECLQQLEALS